MIMKGQKISDRYQIIKSIGEGGMANVYLAYDTILDRNVAVKVLRGDLANDEKFVRRFQREALSASSLSNPTARWLVLLCSFFPIVFLFPTVNQPLSPINFPCLL